MQFPFTSSQPLLVPWVQERWCCRYCTLERVRGRVGRSACLGSVIVCRRRRGAYLRELHHEVIQAHCRALVELLSTERWRRWKQWWAVVSVLWRTLGGKTCRDRWVTESSVDSVAGVPQWWDRELCLWVADELVAGEVCYSRGVYSIGESSVGY